MAGDPRRGTLRLAYTRACLRWHPDRWHRDRVRPEDWERVLEGVQRVSQGLNQAWAELGELGELGVAAAGGAGGGDL